MTDLNHSMLIDAVKTIRKSVDLNHDRCETAFARGLHIRLVNKLDEMVADLRLDAKRLAELRRQLQASEISEEQFKLLTYRMDFEWNWLDDGPISLLDEIHTVVWATARSASSHATTRWFRPLHPGARFGCGALRAALSPAAGAAPAPEPEGEAGIRHRAGFRLAGADRSPKSLLRSSKGVMAVRRRQGRAVPPILTPDAAAPADKIGSPTRRLRRSLRDP